MESLDGGVCASSVTHGGQGCRPQGLQLRGRAVTCGASLSGDGMNSGRVEAVRAGSVGVSILGEAD